MPGYDFDPLREGAFTPLIRDKNDELSHQFMRPNADDPRFVGGRIMHVFLAQDSELELNRYGSHSVRGADYKSSSELSVGKEWKDAFDSVWGETPGEYPETAGFWEKIIQRVLNDPTVDLRHIVVSLDPRTRMAEQTYGFKTENWQHNDLW